MSRAEIKRFYESICPEGYEVTPICDEEDSGFIIGDGEKSTEIELPGRLEELPYPTSVTFYGVRQIRPSWEDFFNLIMRLRRRTNAFEERGHKSSATEWFGQHEEPPNRVTYYNLNVSSREEIKKLVQDATSI